MIILSIVSIKDKTIEMTDVVNIANGDDLRCPDVIKELICSFYGAKKEALSLLEYSPFNDTFIFEWEYKEGGEFVCARELVVFWKELKQ